MNFKTGILIFLFAFYGFLSMAQSKDSVVNIDTIQTKIDSSVVKNKHNPRIATRRSLILPGWGQAYNREYWKIPIVYGVLAIPTATYISNTKYYKMAKFAYNALYAATYGSNSGGPTHADTLNLQNINPEIRDRVIAGTLDLPTLQNARNTYRKNRDYSIFWFIIVWGLNVADATVFGHLKDFDISSNLSMHIEPTLSPGAKLPGISLVFNLQTPKKRIRTVF